MFVNIMSNILLSYTEYTAMSKTAHSITFYTVAVYNLFLGVVVFFLF